MKAYVGITDREWFDLLADTPDIEEVNFWQPGGKHEFHVLAPGELFLFKLHSPTNFIVGGGFFAHSTLLPVGIAWQAFNVKNGARTLEEMRLHIAKYRHEPSSRHDDYTIGCILLEQPFFFEERDWIKVPSDWNRNIVQGKTYDLESGLGRSLFDEVQIRLQSRGVYPQIKPGEDTSRYGKPILVAPRLGQGSFRVIVTDAYYRRCAITQERTLPVLQAAHIKPFSDGGEHRIDNGLLLRSDLHTLFDQGYITAAPDYHIEVSKRIREEYENGREYYALHGKSLVVPKEFEKHPSKDFLQWHNENIFLV